MTLLEVARGARSVAFGQAVTGAMTCQQEMTDYWVDIAFRIDAWGEKRWGGMWGNPDRCKHPSATWRGTPGVYRCDDCGDPIEVGI